MMDWDDLKYFLAVAQTRSLSAAALQLAVSPSTVSRRIDALERALQVKLFRAHRDGYDLMPAGQDLIPAAERASAQMRLFQRSAQGKDSDHAGPVRIEAPELLAQDVIMPALREVLDTYPAIRIELRSSVRTVRLAGEESDIILRLARPDQGSYRMRRLRPIAFGLYASADYVAQNGTPARPEDLLNHKIIGWSEDLHYLAMASWLDALCPGLQPALRLTSLGAQLSAVRNDLGWAVLPEFAAKPAGLVTALEGVAPLNPDLWLLVHEQSAALPRVDLIRKLLVRVLSQNPPA